MSFLSREAIIAPLQFNRWLIPPAALAIHLSIGQVYAFSVFKTPLMERFGVGDVAVGWIFSFAIAMLGLSAAFMGSWVDRVGPRKSMVVAGLCWVVGFFVATAGIALGQLWVVYLGYGFIGGIGLGIGYISPVSTLIKWFPDRPGLATGLAIMGFGSGAMIASPASNMLMTFFGGGSETPNLVAGLTPTFLTLAVFYTVIIAFGAYVIRLPHPDWKPAGWDPSVISSKPLQTTGNVSVNKAMKTPQFWFLWTVLFTNVTAGIGILENAAPMIQDTFPAITAGAAAGFVGMLSLTNMGGRFVWSSVSDYIGRKNIYLVYLGVGLVLYIVLATIGSANVALFVISALIILSFYGGGFATIPAYLRDLFGTYQVGAIHGRLLTAWAAAGIAGPLIVNMIGESQKAAGQEGPALYQLTLYIMAGILAVGLLANILVRPVSDKHFEDEEVVKAKLDADRKAAEEKHDSRAAAAHSGGLHATVSMLLALFVGASLIYGLAQTVIRAIGLFS